MLCLSVYPVICNFFVLESADKVTHFFQILMLFAEKRWWCAPYFLTMQLYVNGWRQEKSTLIIVYIREKEVLQVLLRSYRVVLQWVVGAFSLFFCATEVLPEMLLEKVGDFSQNGVDFFENGGDFFQNGVDFFQKVAVVFRNLVRIFLYVSFCTRNVMRQKRKSVLPGSTFGSK